MVVVSLAHPAVKLQGTYAFSWKPRVNNKHSGALATPRLIAKHDPNFYCALKLQKNWEQHQRPSNIDLSIGLKPPLQIRYKVLLPRSLSKPFSRGTYVRISNRVTIQEVETGDRKKICKLQDAFEKNSLRTPN